MERKTIMVCFLATVLGIAAAAAGFVAESRRDKDPTLTVVYIGKEPKFECEYQRSPSTGLAMAATVALVIARVIITSVSGGCCLCCQTIRSLPRFARICVVISWITASIAIVLFIVGAILSSNHGVQRDSEDEYYCYIVRPGIFMGAAIMTLLSVVLALVHDLAFASGTNVVVVTSRLELGVPKAEPITDGKKQPITIGKNPSQKH